MNQVLTTGSNFYQSDYIAVVNAIIAIYEQIDSTVNATYNPRADMAACLVRAGGHDYMDYRINQDGTSSGGMDGCINFNDGDNAGLLGCL